MRRCLCMKEKWSRQLCVLSNWSGRQYVWGQHVSYKLQDLTTEERSVVWSNSGSDGNLITPICSWNCRILQWKSHAVFAWTASSIGWNTHNCLLLLYFLYDRPCMHTAILDIVIASLYASLRYPKASYWNLNRFGCYNLSKLFIRISPDIYISLYLSTKYIFL